MSLLEDFRKINNSPLQIKSSMGLQQNLEIPSTDEDPVSIPKTETEYEKAKRIFREKRLLVIESKVLNEQIVFVDDETTLEQYPQHQDKVFYTLEELKDFVLKSDRLSEDELRIIHLIKKETLMTKTPCRVCGSLEKWKTADGQWLCGKCHPPASPTLAVKWFLKVG